MKAKKNEPRYLEDYPVGHDQRMRVRFFAICNWSYSRVAPSAVPALSGLARVRRKALLSKPVLEGLTKLGRHELPDAVILRHGVRIPAWWRVLARKRIRAKPGSSRWACRAMKQVIAYMGTAGYVPLVHCYDNGKANYFFHAQAIEDQLVEPTYPHKLPDQAATAMPNLPFGSALFGTGAKFEGTIAPDAVAFIMLESAPRAWEVREELGPRLFFLDEFERELGAAEVEGLREKNFRVDPDPVVKSPDGNVFGMIDEIKLFGRRGETGARYMRFHMGRIRPSSNPRSAAAANRSIGKLRNAIMKLINDNRNARRLNLRRGDILIVNNWRVATMWERTCKSRGRFLGLHRSSKPVVPGDRVILQLNFYLEADSLRMTHGAASDKSTQLDNAA